MVSRSFVLLCALVSADVDPETSTPTGTVEDGTADEGSTQQTKDNDGIKKWLSLFYSDAEERKKRDYVRMGNLFADRVALIATCVRISLSKFCGDQHPNPDGKDEEMRIFGNGKKQKNACGRAVEEYNLFSKKVCRILDAAFFLSATLSYGIAALCLGFLQAVDLSGDPTERYKTILHIGLINSVFALLGSLSFSVLGLLDSSKRQTFNAIQALLLFFSMPFTPTLWVWGTSRKN